MVSMEIKYKLNAAASRMLTAIYNGEYLSGGSVPELVNTLGLDEKTSKALLKKLKGKSFDTDMKNLIKLGGLNEEEAKEQIRKIYAIGTQLGIKGRGRDDLLHELVYGVTGKNSIGELTDKEANAVLSELYKRQPPAPKAKSKAKKKKKNGDDELGYNGMATPDQQRLCWRYCYRLKELDSNPDSAEVFERLKGAITKVCGTNIVPIKTPFRCVTQEQCSKLIEQLKRYVNTAERRAKRQGGGSG